MAENTEISWCDHTFNPWVGCTKVSAACDFCYAEVWAKRTGHPELWQGEWRRTSSANWKQPLKWDREAAALETRKRVFCASLADVFDNQVPTRWRDDLWFLIDRCQNLDFLLLTKRPQNIAKMLPDVRTGIKPWGDGWPNVWLGITAENQEEYNRRWPYACAIPAHIHFVSYEPALGLLDILRPHQLLNIPDWVICGGESGPHARPMHPDWARSIRDQCQTAGIWFHFKQWGQWLPGENLGWPLARWQDGNEGRHPSPDHIEWRHFTTPGEYGAFTIKVGKKAAGRLLDGRIWDEMPMARIG